MALKSKVSQFKGDSQLLFSYKIHGKKTANSKINIMQMNKVRNPLFKTITNIEL